MKHTKLAHKLFCDLTVILTDTYLTYPIFLAHAAPFMRASARELALSGKSVCAFLSSADFIFKINFFRKILPELPFECLTDWIQIRPDILWHLI